MIVLILILLASLTSYYLIVETEREMVPMSQKVGVRLERLWKVAQIGMSEKKYLRAEKALLTILKLDQKNAAAYNRLGILYSRQKEYKDAIECFEIASSIRPSASSLHNLGLIYFETENYQKAAQAFEASIRLEEDVATRHIAYAKVQEQLDNKDQVIGSLTRAIELEPRAQTYKLLADAYQRNGNLEEAKIALKKRDKLEQASESKPAKKRVRRVIY